VTVSVEDDVPRDEIDSVLMITCGWIEWKIRNLVVCGAGGVETVLNRFSRLEYEVYRVGIIGSVEFRRQEFHVDFLAVIEVLKECKREVKISCPSLI
jgi:hypothetical protein